MKEKADSASESAAGTSVDVFQTSKRPVTVLISAHYNTVESSVVVPDVLDGEPEES